jgi:hypothetical protein
MSKDEITLECLTEIMADNLVMFNHIKVPSPVGDTLSESGNRMGLQLELLSIMFGNDVFPTAAVHALVDAITYAAKYIDKNELDKEAVDEIALMFGKTAQEGILAVYGEIIAHRARQELAAASEASKTAE